MALKIRLRKQGRTNRQTFRLVVTDLRNPRDGKYLEMLGSYNPAQKDNNFKINEERLNFWLSQGALLSDNAQKLVAKTLPEAIKAMTGKQHQKRVKLAAKRRALKKVDKKGETVTKKLPAKPATKKKSAPKKAAATSVE
jgi:small subunit ribosomal protein S16